MNNHSDTLPLDLAQAVAANDTFTTLSKAIEIADLTDTLKSAGPYTMFAPTDAAFAQLPEGMLENWLKPENRAELISVLQYHIVRGRISPSDIGRMRDTPTVQGEKARIKMADGRITIDEANVSLRDVASKNGVIYSIDKVIMPSGRLPTRH